ncbi:MAG: oligosaccharide flippase family protein [Prevotellaceae bacterium]|nr:oligosaccharide flippase family protein [Prevotellaceae bacterium]
MMQITKQYKQVFMLYGSTLFGVVLGFIASIVNTNALSPEDYGDIRYVQNIIQFLSWILLLGYFQAGSRLLATTEGKEDRRLLRGGMIVILALACIALMSVTVLLSFFHLGNPTVANLFLVSVPVCFYPLLINYVNTTAQGDNFIGRLSMARLLPALIYIPVAYCIYNSVGATSSLMMLLQWGIYSLILFVIIVSTKPKFRDLKLTFRTLNAENKAYGLDLYYGSLAMVATSYIGGITLGLFNDDNSDVGLYTLAFTVTTPLSYLPAIVGTTYFRLFAQQSSIPSKVFVTTVLMTVGSCILFVLLIQPLIEWLYPAEYIKVGVYASWLSVGFSVHGVGDMINRYLGSHGEGKPIFVSSVICGIIKVIGFFLFVYYWNIYGAIMTNVLSSLIYFAMLFFYYKRSLTHQG